MINIELNKVMYKYIMRIDIISKYDVKNINDLINYNGL